MARAIAEHVHGWTDDGIGAGLVHGDLAGHNMHWVDGQLIGILDWDYAALWDSIERDLPKPLARCPLRRY